MDADSFSQGSDFAEVWADLAPRLQRMLRSRSVPRDFVDDLVQETGIRLYRGWSEVDPETVWALANTILRNLVLDEMRKQEVRQRHAEQALAGRNHDFEETVLYRLELRRVEKVLKKLSVVDQQVLLAEWGADPAPDFVSPAALKMARMRARKRLRAALENASGLAPLWRLRDVLVGRGRAIVAFAEQLSPIAAALVFVAVSGLAGSPLDVLPSPSGGSFSGRVPAAWERIAAFSAGPSGTDWAVGPSGAFGLAGRSQGSIAPTTLTSGAADDDRNDKFEVIRTGNGGVWVGGTSEVGPWDTDVNEGVETSAAGEEAEAHVRVYYEGPQCSVEVTVGTPSTDECDPGKSSAHAEARAGGTGYEVDTGS